MSYSINKPNFIAWGCLYFARYLAVSTCIVIVCLTGCEVIKFEISLVFLITSFFLHDQKGKTKI